MISNNNFHRGFHLNIKSFINLLYIKVYFPKEIIQRSYYLPLTAEATAGERKLKVKVIDIDLIVQADD